MKVFLDDVRSPYEGWNQIRTIEEVIALLENGLVTDLSLDHDLGSCDSKSGYDLVSWIEEKVMKENWVPPNLYCHSMNPVGKDKIQLVIDRIGRYVEAYIKPFKDNLGGKEAR